MKNSKGSDTRAMRLRVIDRAAAIGVSYGRVKDIDVCFVDFLGDWVRRQKPMDA